MEWNVVTLTAHSLHSSPPDHPNASAFYCHLISSLIFKTTKYVQLVLPKCAWMWGHLSEHEWPICGHSRKEKGFSLS